jgi:hypothetical protein
MMAYHRFLSKRHSVDIIKIPDGFFSKFFYYYHRAYSNLWGFEERLMNKIADRLEKIIKREAYDIVICVETLFSQVLTRDIECIKLFSYESPEADELYFSGKDVTLQRFRALRELEVDIIESSDHVIFPWKTSKRYVERYIIKSDNFIVSKFGCYPKIIRVRHRFPPSIVYLGNLRGYWSNKELLSHLTKTSPYLVEAYSRYRPERRYGLNYKGYAKSLNVLYDYQFGLNTVSRDLLRREHFSSKIINYLAHGLPVLYPEWEKFPRELGGCLSYNEDNFSEVVGRYGEKEEWDRVSDAAMDQAEKLDWNITLKPLEKIINNYLPS